MDVALNNTQRLIWYKTKESIHYCLTLIITRKQYFQLEQTANKFYTILLFLFIKLWLDAVYHTYDTDMCETYIECSKHIYIEHHHHVAPPARISLTLSRHFSLSFIASGRSSGLHPVSSHSCCMYVRAGRPTLAHPYVGVHRSTSLMSSSLLLQQCPACLVRRTCIVFVMGGKCPYSWSLVGCCRQDLFNTALKIPKHEKHVMTS